MRIYIKDTQEIRKITLREWKNGNWSQNLFDDLDPYIPRDFPTDPYNEEEKDASATMTEADYNEIVEWWRHECFRYNQHDIEDNNWFVADLDRKEREEEYARGAKMILDWD